MDSPSAIERERINHINCLMDELEANNTEIYESLMDRDFDILGQVIDRQIVRLQELRNSITDDV